ncbi:MAG TPA: hypothetical protein VLG09_04275 [Candidatus Saccharimonadales bacterium]|nr:hypothetical protein [Candidatus Saccharimonadales bacterium]
MGSQGSTTVDFGSFPGASNTSVAITGIPSILTTSLIEAWLLPVATADHSADEHIVDGPIITAGNISLGVGFTIYAVARDGIPVPDAIRSNGAPGNQSTQEHGRKAPMPYGLWTVAWVWN